jgi:predicted metal-binding membrane protein
MLRALAPLNRDAGLWLAFYGGIIAAWVALFMMVRASPAAGFGAVPEGFWASLCLAAEAASFPALAAMWGLMAAAMMMPTFAPALATFRDLAATGATDDRAAGALVGGYLAVWGGAALLGAAAQRGLSEAGLIAPDGSSLSGWLTALLLVVAGAYQFSALKAACLARCRMPLAFFLERWRPGAPAAARMGVELGLLCLGCCWALMALAFVGGTMNLMWMGAATLFMALEKLPEIGRPLTAPAGIALIAAGLAAALDTAGLV